MAISPRAKIMLAKPARTKNMEVFFSVCLRCPEFDSPAEDLKNANTLWLI
jgi:hypothetical protein